MRVGRRVGTVVGIAALRGPRHPVAGPRRRRHQRSLDGQSRLGSLRHELALPPAGYGHGDRQRAGLSLLHRTVSTTAFTTGAGGPGQTIGKASISYWSGPATVTARAEPDPRAGQCRAGPGPLVIPHRLPLHRPGAVDHHVMEPDDRRRHPRRSRRRHLHRHHHPLGRLGSCPMSVRRSSFSSSPAWPPLLAGTGAGAGPGPAPDRRDPHRRRPHRTAPTTPAPASTSSTTSHREPPSPDASRSATTPTDPGGPALRRRRQHQGRELPVRRRAGGQRPDDLDDRRSRHREPPGRRQESGHGHDRRPGRRQPGRALRGGVGGTARRGARREAGSRP